MVEEIVGNLKKELVEMLTSQVKIALEEASMEIAKQRGIQSGTTNIYPEIEAICQRFGKYLNFDFDKLVKTPQKKRAQLIKGTLALAHEDFYESANAMEGMVVYARNANMREYISFTTRLNSIFFNFNVDETTNPLDPELIGQAFVDALRPVTVDAHGTLVIYRKFNQKVFYKLGKILERANQILVENNVKPSLVVYAQSRKDQLRKRNRNRSDTDPIERAFAEDNEEKAKKNRDGAPELFAIIQNLTHGLAPNQKNFGRDSKDQTAVRELAIPVAAMSGQQLGGGMVAGLGLMLVDVPPDLMLGGLKVQLIARQQLLDILTDIQNKANDPDSTTGDVGKGSQVMDSIGLALKDTATQGTISAIDIPSYDIINVLAMLYDAIADDVSLVAPIKKLICSTQLTIIKLALSDANFFDKTQHPARTLLNNVANAGIGWTDLEKLENDTTYRKMKELVGRLVTGFDSDVAFIEDLLSEYDQFKSQDLENTIETKEQAEVSGEQNERIDNIGALASQRIKERITEEIPPLVTEILLTHFHKFMIDLILREGVGSNSWKHVINTIDELLWTVKADKQSGDRERFEKINPQILANLASAFSTAGTDEVTSKGLLSRLKELQNETFKLAESREKSQVAAEMAAGVFELDSDIHIDFGDEDEAAEDDLSLPEVDEYLLQVNKLPLGVWLEFRIDERRKMPCTLAAKLETIDKFIFVNRQGIKMMERTRTGLAMELKNGTVKIISEWPLFERAMEALIGILRENKAA
ncbi:MAG: DUF1631 family protein [Gammaproteobacteria bacterium]|nr:DUF1631 family protein [Gammaproteobacteria bacterium]